MRRFVVVLGTAIVATACGSHTAVAPTPHLVVTLSGASIVKGYQDSTTNGTLGYTCPFHVTATATGGSPGEAASWLGGYFTVLFPNGGVDEYTFPSPAQFDHGDSTIEAGAQAILSPLPVGVTPPSSFQLSLTLYYGTLQSPYDSAAFSFTCQ
jgi:hypothetical protein